jgi:UDP-GlcNAc:undecaprenyl-phosphate GlcNAc-1-phosphate transferase
MSETSRAWALPSGFSLWHRECSFSSKAALPMILAICFFALGFLVSFLTTPAAIRFGQRGFALDTPNETRKRHAVPITRLGGVPIVLSLAVCASVILIMDSRRAGQWMPVLIGCVLMFVLGFWDDLRALGARRKLLAQIAIAVLVYAMGLGIDRVTYPGGAWNVELGRTLGFLATIFWLIAVPNIVNLIDGFDGLAGGLGMFMAVTLGIVGLLAEQLAVAWFAFAMAGAALGFLVFNFPPAKIFLGDGGAYLLGFFIAAVSLLGSHKGSIASVLLVTIVALGVPILDTTFALLRRAVRGFPIFHADDEHFHHKLERLGFSKRRVVLGMYGICVVLSLIGLSIFWSQGRTLPIGVGALFILAVVVLRYFHFLYSWDELQRRVRRVINRRREVRYALLQAQLLEMEVERCKSAQEFWTIFDVTMRRVGFVEPGEVADEIAVHVKYNGSAPWTLHAPPHRGHPGEWQRIAECFRPVYIKAQARWKR